MFRDRTHLCLVLGGGNKWSQVVDIEDGSYIRPRKIANEDVGREFSSNYLERGPVSVTKAILSYLYRPGYTLTANLAQTLKEYIMTALTEKTSEADIITAISEVAIKLPDGHKWKTIPKRFANKKAAIQRYNDIAKLVTEGSTTSVAAVVEDGSKLAKKVKEKVAKSKERAEKVTNSNYKVLKKKGAEGLTVRESSDRGKVLIAMWASKAKVISIDDIVKGAGIEVGKVRSAINYLVARDIIAAA